MIDVPTIVASLPLVGVMMIFAWAFGELSFRFMFASLFGVPHEEADSELDSSAHRLCLCVGALIFLVFVVELVSRFSIWGLLATAVIWLGGGNALFRYGDHLPVIGKGLKRAVAAHRAAWRKETDR